MSEQPLYHHHVQYAGFMRRLCAVVIDGMMVSVITAVLVSALFGMQSLGVNSITELDQLNWKIMLLEHGLPLIWSVGFWLLWLATPGKLMMDSRVVDATTLGKARPGQLLIRYLGYILSALPLGLGFLWIFFDKRNQSWHDKLSNTLVILQDESLQTFDTLSFHQAAA